MKLQVHNTPRLSHVLRKVVFIGLLLTVCCGYSFADTASIDEAAATFMAEGDLPGLAVVAVAQTKEGLKTWSSAYGLSNIEQNVSVTTDTSFWFASISKVVLASALMRAQEQGRLSLESKVVEILSQFGAFTLGKESLENVTIDHLATHRSTIVDSDVYACTYFVGDADGEHELLVDLFGIANNCTDGSPVTLDGYLESYLSSDGVYYDEVNNFLSANPGEQAEYSNIGAALAGYVLELVTNMSLPDYTIQEFFGPLGMENTSYRVSDLEETVVATPYTSENGYIADIVELPIYEDATFPDGGLRTSVNDMARFLGAIMNEGTLELENDDSFSVLKPTSVEAMITPRFVFGDGEIGVFGDGEIGVFWFVLTIPFNGGERSVVGHHGGDLGALSYMFFDPVTKTGFFFVANGDIGDADPFELVVALIEHADEMKQKAETTAPNETTPLSSSAPYLNPTNVLIVSVLGLFPLW